MGKYNNLVKKDNLLNRKGITKHTQVIYGGYN